MKFQARVYLSRRQSVLIDKIILTPRRGTLVLVDISRLFSYLGIDICLFIEYRNMMKTMNATSFNRRPDANPSSSSTQATFANASTMADRLSGKTSGNNGDKKSVLGGLRKSTM